jgi:hypothetical protein
VPQSVSAELYLRLWLERELLAGSEPGLNDAAQLVLTAQTFVAAGTITSGAAAAALEEYALARRLRWPHYRSLLRSQRETFEDIPAEEFDARRLPPARIALCGKSFERGDRQVTCLVALLSEDRTRLELSGVTLGRAAPPALEVSHRFGAGLPFLMRSRGGGGGAPDKFRCRDDRGTTTTARFAGGCGGGDSWHGAFTTDAPLSTKTTFVELSGHRLELAPSPVAPPKVAMQRARRDPDPLRALLYRILIGGVGLTRLRYEGIGPLVDALIATGALEEMAPLIAELEQAEELLGVGSMAQRPAAQRRRKRGRTTPELASPWSTVVARLCEHDGPTFTIPLGAALQFRTCSIRLELLASAPQGFAVSVVGWPSVFVDGQFGVPELERPTITWWAEDDCGNSYLGTPGGATSSVLDGRNAVSTATIEFTPALHPVARRLRLLATYRNERGVVRVGLPRSSADRKLR